MHLLDHTCRTTTSSFHMQTQKTLGSRGHMSTASGDLPTQGRGTVFNDNSTHFSAHLSDCQQNWHPFEQEMWGLLCARRDSIKHLGRIPAVMHTDHANITRLDALPLSRVEPKHFRWIAELLQGGSRLLYRPGTGALHKGPDAISRHPEGRDQLILAKADQWAFHRASIRGLEQATHSGEFDDEEPEMIAPADLPPEKLAPLSYAELVAKGAIGDGSETQIQRARRKKFAEAAPGEDEPQAELRGEPMSEGAEPTRPALGSSPIWELKKEWGLLLKECGDSRGGAAAEELDRVTAAEESEGFIRVLVLGPWASAAKAEELAIRPAQRIGHAAGCKADCVLLDAPFQMDNSLDGAQFWLRLTGRSPEERRKELRRQGFTGLAALLAGAVRWGPDVIAGIGQGGLITALAALPMVVEAACRTRVVTPEEMREYRRAWGRVRALIIADPVLLLQRSSWEEVLEAFPEATKVQPAGVLKGRRKCSVPTRWESGGPTSSSTSRWA